MWVNRVQNTALITQAWLIESFEIDSPSALSLHKEDLDNTVYNIGGTQGIG